MPYVAAAPEKYAGKSVGNGQCVAYARTAAAIGHTSTWRRGAIVRGNTLPPGTAIATFSKDGKYENDTLGRSHAAIYLSQDATGIRVLDQWIDRKTLADGRVEVTVHPVHERVIGFHYTAKAVNDGRNYYVIE